MNPKYWISRSNKCPWCGKESPITGNECGHLFKITKSGNYYWYWGIRPIEGRCCEALKTLRQWDMLNPLAGSPEFTADAPWARKLIDDALAKAMSTDEKK